MRTPFFNFSRLSLLTLIAGTALILGFLYSLFNYWDYIHALHERVLQRHQSLMTNYYFISKNYLEDKKLTQLEETFKNAKASGYFHFYLLKENDNVIFFYEPSNDVSLINHNYPLDGEILEYETAIITQLKVGSFQLIYGINKNPHLFFQLASKGVKYDFLSGLIIFLLIVAGVSAFFLRDLKYLSKKLMTPLGDRKLFQPLNARSREGVMLKQGLQGYENHLEDLVHLNEILNQQVLPALKSELHSGKKPPYSFQCSILILDINHFTNIFEQSNREEFIKTIQNYFLNLAHIASKHRGLVYKFVGDEVIIYFKEDFDVKSIDRSLACALELEKEAHLIHQENISLNKHAFIVKIAITTGEMTVSPLIQTLELFGTPIIKASRLLSQIEIKEKNQIVVEENVKGNAASCFLFSAEKTVTLKGLEGVHRMFYLIQKKPLESYLEKEILLPVLNCYREDLEVSRLLDFIKDQVLASHWDKVNTILFSLRSIQITTESRPITDAFLNLISSLEPLKEETQLNDQERKEIQKVLSAVIGLTPYLFTKIGFSTWLLPAFKKLLLSEDKRVIANVLDAFIFFLPESNDPEILQHLGSENNRILANTIVKTSLREITSATIKNLNFMLNSSNPLFCASGIWAIGKISHYHKEHYPVSYQAHYDFTLLREQVTRKFNHPDEMVRRQCFIAVLRMNDEKINSRLESFYFTSQNSEIKREIETHYFNQKKNKSHTTPSLKKAV